MIGILRLAFVVLAVSLVPVVPGMASDGHGGGGKAMSVAPRA